MFFTYLWDEIRRRRKQTFLVATALGLGVALVITVSAMAAGVADAQSTVLSSLYGVATDATVTQTSSGGAAGGPAFQVNQGGSQGFSRDQILSDPGLDTFSDSRVAAVAGQDGVASAAGGLSLTATHIKGKLPTFPQPGSTDSAASGTGAVPSSSASATGPQQATFSVSAFSLLGLDVANDQVGPVTSSQIMSGRWFTSAEENRDVAVLTESYAAEEGLHVGDTFALGGKDFKVIGIASGASSSGSDVVIPLARAQALASEKDKINTIYVQATSSTQVEAVKAEIQAAFPKASVTTASDLASQVSGSLSSASNLLGRLGTWLSIAVIVAVVALASLLTLSSVTRRTRELGTLKAIGWRSRRVVGQVMGESLTQGLLGGAIGLVLGIAGAAAVTQLAPSLSATVSGVASGTVFAGPPGAGGPGADPFSTTIQVALKAPISAEVAALAIGLALLAALIAGSFGGWRAARLRPADAMRQLI